MYKVEDSIAQQRFIFTHSAPALPLEAGIRRWPRWRLVQAHVARHGATHVCVSVDADGVEVWRVGCGSGLSMVAAIEAWLQTSQMQQEAVNVGRCQLLVPLDKRIYIAQVEDGLIVSEQALVESRAIQAIRDSGDGPLYALDTGALTCQSVAQIAQFLPCDFDLHAYRYELTWLAFLKRKMPHRILFLPPLAAALSLAFYLNVLPTKAVFERTLDNIKPVLVTSEVSFSAAPTIRRLAAAMTRDFAGHLAKFNLKRIQLQNRTLSVLGHSSKYPGRLAEIAKSYLGFMDIQPDGWRLELPEMTVLDMRPVAEFSDIQMLEEIYAVAHRLQGQVKLRGTAIEKNIRRTTLEIKMTKPTRLHLERLAAALENFPVSASEAICDFSPWLPTECLFVLDIRTHL